MDSLFVSSKRFHKIIPFKLNCDSSVVNFYLSHLLFSIALHL